MSDPVSGVGAGIFTGETLAVLAPWVQAVGSFIGLGAAYYFGRAEKRNKQSAYAMTAWVAANDCFSCLNEAVARLIAESEHSPGFFSRLSSSSHALAESVAGLMQFPMHELKTSVVQDFHLFRVNSNQICAIIHPIASNKQSIFVEEVAQVLRDFVYADQAMTRLKHSLGLDGRTALEEERKRAAEIATFRDVILKAQEERVAQRPGGQEEAAAVRRQRSKGWPNAKQLRRVGR